jgi:hypothetical protein
LIEGHRTTTHFVKVQGSRVEGACPWFSDSINCGVIIGGMIAIFIASRIVPRCYSACVTGFSEKALSKMKDNSKKNYAGMCSKGLVVKSKRDGGSNRCRIVNSL